MELLPEINSVILKEKISGITYYLTGCKTRKFYGVNMVVLVVIVVVVVIEVLVI